ncbi:MAG: TonB-dependent receptor, partial [Ignavibacteriaceae bacterium]
MHIKRNSLNIIYSSQLIIITILILFSGSIFGSGKIQGKITDLGGDPLIGANVLVNGIAVGASTDTKGDFIILNVPPGSYSLTASYIGYESVTVTDVNVISNRTVKVDFELPVRTIQQEEIVVKAERPIIDKDLTSSEQIITSENLEKSGQRTIMDVLETQAGIFSDNSNLAWQRGRTQAYFRGSSKVQAVYMIDNLSVNSGLVSDNYSGFNTSTIEQISVLTGGYNAEYGEGRSAVINIISKEAYEGIHGNIISRMRPAGVYHFGRNMYSNENNDYIITGIDYWTLQSRDVNSRYYQMNPDSLLQAWRKETTPNDVL